jgi:hypothetical protein
LISFLFLFLVVDICLLERCFLMVHLGNVAKGVCFFCMLFCLSSSLQNRKVNRSLFHIDDFFFLLLFLLYDAVIEFQSLI